MDFKGEFNEQEQGFIRRTMDELLLPEPDAGEIIGANNQGRMVFITPAGCVLRVFRKSATPLFQDGLRVHDHVIQPLGFREEGDVVVALYPGTLVPGIHTVKTLIETDPEFKAGVEKAKEVGQLVARNGFEMDDPHFFNIGYLPGTESYEWPEGHPVIIDLDSISRVPGVSYEDLRKPKTFEDLLARKAPVQHERFADLRAAFAQAITGTQEQKEAFWSACRDALGGPEQEGRLAADWQSTVYQGWDKVERLPAAASSYEQRLKQSPVFAKSAPA